MLLFSDLKEEIRMTSDASGSFRICGLAFPRKIKYLFSPQLKARWYNSHNVQNMCIITSRSDMASESNWSLFLNVVEDLFNVCENHMSGEDYSTGPF